MEFVGSTWCPHCDSHISLDALRDNDGFCPICNCEIELDED